MLFKDHVVFLKLVNHCSITMLSMHCIAELHQESKVVGGIFINLEKHCINYVPSNYI